MNPVRGIVLEPTLGRVLAGLTFNRGTGRLPLFDAGPVSFRTLQPRELPGPSWVRVRCRLAGICGSDLNLIRLKFSIRSASLARQQSLPGARCLGHEAVGEVEELGTGVRTLTLGQRILLVPGIACAGINRADLCPMCERGLPLLCLNRDTRALPLAAGGGWSEEFVRHESQLIPVPDDINDEQAVLVEPLACSTHAELRRPPDPGDRVVVIGCGAIGLGIILALRALRIPLKIIAIFKHAHQSARATASGADLVLPMSSPTLYEGLAAELGTDILSRGSSNRLLHCGAAVVYDAVGSGRTLGHALRWTRPRGVVVIEGISPRPAPFDCTAIWLREVDLIGSHGHGFEDHEGRRLHTFQLVLEWIQQGRISTEGLVTHRYPLSDYKRALRAAQGKAHSKAVKVLLEM